MSKRRGPYHAHPRAAVLAVLAALSPWAAGPVAEEAAAPVLGLPLDCVPGDHCTVQALFDHDPGPGYRDYHCGLLSYDGHHGTDIRVPSLVEMREGMTVRAAAAGRVRAVRDDMPDVSTAHIPRAAIRGREAGNAVVLTHPGGWETQYSHLRHGSVRVAPGDTVAAGAPLGLLGLSGGTEYPHLEFGVRHRGRPVDPFTGPGGHDACGPGPGALWSPATLEALEYRPTGLLQAGFAPRAPDDEGIRRGDYRFPSLPAAVPVIAFWVEVFGVHDGDTERIRLLGPDGEVLAASSATLEGPKARRWGFVGKRRPGAAWPAGRYRGEYTLRRGDGREVLAVAREIAVERRGD